MGLKLFRLDDHRDLGRLVRFADDECLYYTQSLKLHIGDIQLVCYQ